MPDAQEMLEDVPPTSFENLDRRVGITEVWKRGYRGDGVTVAVVDSGITPGPEWSSAIVDQRDFSGDVDVLDVFPDEHGTNVARLIHLVAPKAGIANLKVWPRTKPSLTDFQQSVIQAIDYCLAKDPPYRVVNLSFAIPRLCTVCTAKRRCVVCQAVNRAAQAGIMVVVAAGNIRPASDKIECPGIAEGAITVGACLNSAERAFLRQTSEPGRWFGTSFSAPYVAGGIALLLSALPEATPDEVRAALTESARSLPNAPANAQGAGLVHFGRALDVLIGPADEAFSSAMQRLYYLAGNRDAQRPDNTYASQPLELALNYIERALIQRGKTDSASEHLETIKSYLVPGCMAEHEQRLDSLLRQCHEAL